jgi:hypothetical protein
MDLRMILSGIRIIVIEIGKFALRFTLSNCEKLKESSSA